MNLNLSASIAATISVLLLSACSGKDPAQEGEMPDTMQADSPAPAPAPSTPMPQGMEMSKDASTMQEHSAMGVVTALDASAGTVTIAHQAVASAGWPAMTMSFKVDAKQASALKPKDQVQFKFTIGTAGDATVTEIEPMPAIGQ
jgi:Cu/Ag efflux protein CusF